MEATPLGVLHVTKPCVGWGGTAQKYAKNNRKTLDFTVCMYVATCFLLVLTQDAEPDLALVDISGRVFSRKLDDILVVDVDVEAVT